MVVISDFQISQTCIFISKAVIVLVELHATRSYNIPAFMVGGNEFIQKRTETIFHVNFLIVVRISRFHVLSLHITKRLVTSVVVLDGMKMGWDFEMTL